VGSIESVAATGSKSAIWVLGLATYRNCLIILEDAGMRNRQRRNVVEILTTVR